MQFNNLEERIEFLRENPIFWSPFGSWALSGTWTHSRVKRTESDIIKDAEHVKRHKAMFDKGILVHSSIIPTGWIAPDTYDYTETYRTRYTFPTENMPERPCGLVRGKSRGRFRIRGRTAH